MPDAENSDRIASAQAAGYSDDEINAYLAPRWEQARAAGYSDGDIRNYLGIQAGQTEPVEVIAEALRGTRPQTQGEASSRSDKTPRNPENVDRFFDRFYVPLSQLAQDMKISPELLIGLVAREYGWTGNGLNNLFGLTGRDKKLRNFAVPEDSIDAFRQSRWFQRLQNLPDMEAMFLEIKRPPVYNDEADYVSKLRDVIQTVNRRLPLWRTQWPAP